MSPRPTTSHRNVVLGGHDGTVLARKPLVPSKRGSSPESFTQGFYQYGVVSWRALFEWLAILFQVTSPWIIVADDRLTPNDAEYLPTDDAVIPGRYTVLAPDRSAIHIDLVATHARPQLSALCQERTSNLNLHALSRHKDCLSSGSELSWCRLQAAHTLSASRPAAKRRKNESPNPTEFSPRLTSSPSLKSSSLRNMLFLREDLHDAWAEYEFGIAPDKDNYRVIPFVSGHDPIAGQIVEIAAMAEPGTRPFDQLLRDHFTQGLLKHVKGVGERHWDFGIGALNLSDSKTWGTVDAKVRLELEMGNRLGESGGSSRRKSEFEYEPEASPVSPPFE